VAKKSVCEFEPLKETERRQRFCPVEWNKTKVFTTFQQSIGIFQEYLKKEETRRSRFTREY